MSKRHIVEQKKVEVAVIFDPFKDVVAKPSQRGTNDAPEAIVLPMFASKEEAQAFFHEGLKKAGSRSHFLSGLLLGQPLSHAEQVECLKLAGYVPKKGADVAHYFAAVESHKPSGQKWFPAYTLQTSGARADKKFHITPKV